MGFKIPVQTFLLQLPLETCSGLGVINRIGRTDPGLGKQVQDWENRSKTEKTDPGLGKQIQD